MLPAVSPLSTAMVAVSVSSYLQACVLQHAVSYAVVLMLGNVCPEERGLRVLPAVSPLSAAMVAVSVSSYLQTVVLKHAVSHAVVLLARRC